MIEKIREYLYENNVKKINEIIDEVNTMILADTQGALSTIRQYMNSLVSSVKTGTADGTISVKNGDTTVDVPVKGLKSGAFTDRADLADYIHKHSSDAVYRMTGYQKPNAASEVLVTDTLNQAIGKLERALDDKQVKGSYLNANSTAVDSSKLGGVAASNYALKSDLPTKISAFTNDTGFITGVSWSDVTSKPSAFTPATHNQGSNTIITLTGYTKPDTTGALVTTDTLNAALGKLEAALDTKQPVGNYATTVNGVANADQLGGLPASSYAMLASPVFTGTPQAPTAAAGTNTNQVATTAFVSGALDTAISGLINNAPAALDTLSELSTALGNDPNFATTVATNIGKKLDADSANYIKSLAVSGRTITYTKGDNTTGTLTTQDTTYDAGTTALLTAGTDTTNRVWPAKQIADYVTGKVGAVNTGVMTVATGSANGTIAVNGSDVAVKGLAGAAYRADNYFALASHTHSYVPLSGGTLTGDLLFSDSGTSTRQIQFISGGNDYSRIASGATASDGGWMEIATADNGNEPIYVRQYSGAYTTITRTATLLDASGNTSFPGTVTATRFNGTVNGYSIAASVPSGAKFTDTVYTHPTTSGNKHIPAGGSSGQILRWSADGTAVWGADNNTTYSAATQSANGLMSAADKKKLDGIATGANAYSHPTGNGNNHIPAGGSSGQILRWSAAGTAAWGADNNTDTKVTNTLATTTKFYVAGTSSASTNTGTQYFDTGVYVSATAGNLYATTMNTGGNITMGGTSGTSCIQLPSGIKLY